MRQNQLKFLFFSYRLQSMYLKQFGDGKFEFSNQFLPSLMFKLVILLQNPIKVLLNRTKPY